MSRIAGIRNFDIAFNHAMKEANRRVQTVNVGPVDFGTCPGYYHEGQQVAWGVEEAHPQVRELIVLAGKQSGKTELGPRWMGRHLQRLGPGDYAVMAPTYPLMAKKPYPAMVNLFCNETRLFIERKADRALLLAPTASKRLWGTDNLEALWLKYSRKYPDGSPIEAFDAFPRDTRILFIHTENPYSLESGAYRAGWLDESGMPSMGSESWRAFPNRFLAFDGPVLHTTTPYTWGPFKSDHVDLATEHQSDDPEYLVGLSADKRIAVVRFESWMNPLFGREQFEFLRSTRPQWYFDMAYRGIYTRPQGQYYDCWDESKHVRPLLRGVPQDTPILVGCDFGPRNFAATFVYIDPEARQAVVFHSYCPGLRVDTADHVAYIKRICGNNPFMCRGGNASENDWRQEFADHGLVILGPTQRDPETRRTKLYNLLQRVWIQITQNCTKLRREVFELGYKLDDEGEPLPEIADENKYHRHAALTYIVDDIEEALQELYVLPTSKQGDADDDEYRVSPEDYRRFIRDST